MTEEDKIWQQIDLYLNGEMAQGERLAFEAAISSDATLAEKVEAMRLTEHVLVVDEAAKLKAQMAKDMAEPKTGMAKWALGALFLAGIGFGAHEWNSAEKKKEVVLKTDSIIQVQPKARVEIENKIVAPKEELAKKPAQEIAQAIVTKPELLPEKQTVSSLAVEPSLQTKVISKEQEAVKPVSTLVLDPCVGLKIEANFYVTATCKGTKSGEVFVKPTSVKGGTAPYLFSISSEKEFGSNEIKGVGEGQYKLLVKDGNNCVVAIAKPVVVHAINCDQASKEYTFNPNYDPAWVIPYDVQKKATLIKIVNKGGVEVFRTAVSEGNPTEWNGESNTGTAIAAGYYLFFIEYTDGTTDKGAIAILR